METIVKKNNLKKNKSSQNLPLTCKQIKRKVGASWAFLENPVYEKGVLMTANLLYYSADKSKVLEQFGKYDEGHFAMFYFGEMDKNIAYIL